MATRHARPEQYGLHCYDLIQAIKWRTVYLDSLRELEAAGPIPLLSRS